MLWDIVVQVQYGYYILEFLVVGIIELVYGSFVREGESLRSF